MNEQERLALKILQANYGVLLEKLDNVLAALIDSCSDFLHSEQQLSAEGYLKMQKIIRTLLKDALQGK